ncbi:MAG: tRNA (adenosine(37)-N6)-threonylcarbamoyltransferase complex transferase subunit TsaD [Anaerolineae bacterium]
MQRILAIETSCDETAAAVIGDGRRVLSNVVASQESLHAAFGGVFPEMASRQHILAITPVIEDALAKAGAVWDSLTAIAVTYGPGLAGSLLVGVNTAKALALARDIPLLGVNHLEGHIYANWLRVAPNADKDDPQFPFVALIVSGGHTDLVLMTEHCRYTSLGSTLDDAAGEAFDKVARMLGLGYPGGPAIQRAASAGDPSAITLPHAWLPGTYDFSFSGLKTAVLRLTRQFEAQGQTIPAADVAAAFQRVVVDVLVEKTIRAAEGYGATEILLAGGVAANTLLRERMAAQSILPVRYPAIWLCTDNAAMIGAAGHFAWEAGRRSGWDLDVVPGLPLVAEPLLDA